ncbi:ABC transporter substrate-binding protein [Pseudoalteromonas luteoviolacea]|uniref:ABC transporter substrate-binding protein n=1 Tax=Pseudoalteromonas luteoviolacea S4054 TaxID=1129367 RepID=A0A0F6A5Y7_9GAMM|nr:ABC transporter substrate binding protein [Pseudoalteromonas luteoviolacea]AOT07750.1 hypothetical protein S4054249_07815 [Pseudoalteromonas luteoviolacea]AOT12666.1 hypothetical protein S40542_07815 [Pseudoalteromonas luteoviolacea]AOT17579.1 hypothetical protein S4054_07810 [Pseudoalteromonas luteoviolacea]KKE81580.1 hypothetical protein N479_22040 [Pseudoalteromonas luteoviolacea S4054]KZN78884.1 hypothetical protein N481_00145 [Pseudoalteromonas luteoviolacea S4047-1]
MLLVRIIAVFTLVMALNSEAKNVLIVETLQVPIITTHTKHIMSTLKRLDELVNVEVFDGNGQSSLIESHIKQQLACDCFDLLVANGTLAAKIGNKVLKNKGIPMVFITVADPEGAGLLLKTDPSNDFITGKVYSVERGTKLEIVNQLFHRKEVNIGIVATSYSAALTDIARIEEIAKDYNNIQLIKNIVEYNDGNTEALKSTYTQAYSNAEKMKSKIDFFWSVNGPFSEKSEFVPFMSGLKPVLYGANISSVKQGALFTVIPDPKEAGAEVAKMALRILNGMHPSHIEAGSTKKNILAFNIKTATSLGIVIPFSLLKLAGEHVYH